MASTIRDGEAHATPMEAIRAQIQGDASHRDLRWLPIKRLRLPVAVLSLMVLAASCGSPSNDALVQTEDDRQKAFSVAGSASYAADEETTSRTTPDGVGLSVDAQYFEPLRVESWMAPDECAFNTMLQLRAGSDTYTSPPFDGPTSDDDLTNEGVLGAATLTTAPDTGAPVVLLLVAIFAHDSVVTLTLPDDVLQSTYSPVDTQPADGWTVLALLVPVDSVQPGQPVAVSLAREDSDEQVESVALSLPPLGSDQTLGVLTPEWVFDAEAVGPQCEPPQAVPPLNRPRQPETDLFGKAVGAKPELPPPGAAPADAAAATADALDAIRRVYDIGDVYDEDKAAHIERPELALQIFREIRTRSVVEPYLSALAPLFDSAVFVSPTEAAVLYRVGPSYHWEIGRVLFIDGSWRVTLGTLCRDLADAGYTCPGVVQDAGPSPLG